MVFNKQLNRYCRNLVKRGVMKIKVLGFALILGLSATLGACGGETTTTPDAAGTASPAAPGAPAAAPEPTDAATPAAPATTPAAPATTPAAPDAGAKTPAPGATPATTPGKKP
jgi:hypothetical protein